MVELQFECAASLGDRAKVTGVALHLGERHLGFNHAHAAVRVYPVDLGALGVQVAYHVAGVGFGGEYPNRHHRLEEGAV